MRTLSLMLLLSGLLGGDLAAADASWSGTWRDSRMKKPSSDLRTIDHGRGDVEFQFDLWNGPPAYSSGGMEGHLSVKDGKATFETTEYGGLCRIDFAFEAKRVVVRQSAGTWDECGFGHGVYADGTFVRVSRKVPKFVRR
jgi:hypothetical protein